MTHFWCAPIFVLPLFKIDFFLCRGFLLRAKKISKKSSQNNCIYVSSLLHCLQFDLEGTLYASCLIYLLHLVLLLSISCFGPLPRSQFINQIPVALQTLKGWYFSNKFLPFPSLRHLSFLCILQHSFLLGTLYVSGNVKTLDTLLNICTI